LSINSRKNLQQNKLTSKDLANDLRNGVLLCNLLNKQISNCIDLHILNPNAELSKTLSVFNIDLFLESLKLNVIDLDLKYYFDPCLLYEHNELKPEILNFLSQLSKCKQFRTNSSFNYCFKSIITKEENEDEEEEEDNYYENNDFKASYYTTYAPCDFFLNNQNTKELNDLTDAFQSNESKAANLFKHLSIKIKTTDYVIRELLMTEDSYISLLTFLHLNFIQPLRKCLNYENSQKINLNIDLMLKIHTILYAQLLEACNDGPGRSVRVCNVLNSFKYQFTHAYTNYFINLNETLDFINNNNLSEFKTILDQCESNKTNNNRKFKLNQLIVCPFQRITKYHLLLKELYFNTEKHKPEAKQTIESTWKQMEDLCKYLNQSTKDQESIEKINRLIRSTGGGGVLGLDLKQYGRFIKDEEIKLQKDLKSKYLFLFEKSIIIANKQLNGKYIYFDSFPINEELQILSNNNNNNNNNGVNVSNAKNKCLTLKSLDKQFKIDFKSEKLKNFYAELINIVKSTQTNDTTHRLNFMNFHQNCVECSVCNRYLNGIFYQGKFLPLNHLIH